MQKIIAIISLLALAGFACHNNGIDGLVLTDPVVEKLDLNYSQLNKSLFIAATISDPQGPEDIDSVTCRIDTLGSESWLLFRAGTLCDTGAHGDIIKRDNVYSFLIDSSKIGAYRDSFRVSVQAFDKDLNESEIEIATLKAGNDPPVLYRLYPPPGKTISFERGDTLVFKIRVTDPQGYEDIVGVIYTITYPKGSVLSDPTFRMRDDGAFGDEKEEDGIFTVHQPYGTSGKSQGLFTFNFTAQDRAGETSDTLKIKLKNPGLTLIYPNLSDTLYSDQTVRIKWESAYIDQVKIEYTTSANSANPDYTHIATVAASLEYHDWKVPFFPISPHCKIKISDPDHPSRYDLSDYEFIISPP